jgi:5-enolpyruvylshikimate-3-phosphate synthase
MAFAVLGLCRPGVLIEDPACVAKTYPGFWDALRALYRHLGQEPAF